MVVCCNFIEMGIVCLKKLDVYLIFDVRIETFASLTNDFHTSPKYAPGPRVATTVMSSSPITSTNPLLTQYISRPMSPA